MADRYPSSGYFDNGGAAPPADRDHNTTADSNNNFGSANQYTVTYCNHNTGPANQYAGFYSDQKK